MSGLESYVPSFLYHRGVGWFNHILDVRAMKNVPAGVPRRAAQMPHATTPHAHLQVEIFFDTEIETYTRVPFFTRIDPLSPKERQQHEQRRALRGRPVQGAAAAAASVLPGASGASPGAERAAPPPAADSEGEEEEEEEEEEGEGAEGGSGELGSQRTDGTYTSNFLPLIPAGHPVSGFVRVRTPPGRCIPWTSITASLEVTLFGLDDIATRLLYSDEVQLQGAGEAQGTRDIPFSFLAAGQGLLPESYEGAQFSIRHAVFVRVERPWYTFDCSGRAPFALQRVHNVPFGRLTAPNSRMNLSDLAGGGLSRSQSGAGLAGLGSGSGSGSGSGLASPVAFGASLAAAAAAAAAAQSLDTSGDGGGLGGGEESEAASAVTRAQEPGSFARQYATQLPAEVVNGDWSVVHPISLTLETWPRTHGSVTLHLTRALFELSDVVRGQIQFSGITKPIVLVKLAVVRIEYSDGQASD